MESKAKIREGWLTKATAGTELLFLIDPMVENEDAR